MKTLAKYHVCNHCVMGEKTIKNILIGPGKLPGLSRNGPQAPNLSFNEIRPRAPMFQVRCKLKHVYSGPQGPVTVVLVTTSITYIQVATVQVCDWHIITAGQFFVHWNVELVISKWASAFLHPEQTIVTLIPSKRMCAHCFPPPIIFVEAKHGVH